MSYGTSKSGPISSDNTDPFEIVLNNNADIFNIAVKPLAEFTSGHLLIEASNIHTGVYEPIYCRDGRATKIYLATPRTVLLKHNSLHKLRITPVDLDAGKSYEVIVENLSSWSDG